ncbi:MAG: agmatine deiminase family protein, partial [Bacteroidales bacterium]
NFMEDPLGDYIEHIDCWGKFLGVDKVLIGQVSPNDSRYNDYEEVADFFANAVSAWGNHYRVYRVFTPGGFADVTPYTNSLILNDHVFVPQTGSRWDADAITAYQQAMPGYTIVPVMESTYTPWENTDALHCRTHEMADLRMLLIQHKPLLGNQTYQNSYTIDADITAYSGETLIADSVLIYYKINDDPWQSSVMLSVGGKRWEGTISGVPEGSEVKYYLFAKDESQRREKHPYIGIHDPHTFMAGSVGIAQTNPNRFKLYPNPVSEYCIITGGYVEQVTVFNSIGQLMEQRQVKDQTIRLACSSWNSGIYFIKLEDETGNFTVKRMIKK